MKIRRKFCKLHGWAPHRFGRMGDGYPSGCCRCNGVPGMTRAAKIKAFFRGFTLPGSVRAKDFLGGRFG